LLHIRTGVATDFNISYSALVVPRYSGSRNSGDWTVR